MHYDMHASMYVAIFVVEEYVIALFMNFVKDFLQATIFGFMPDWTAGSSRTPVAGAMRIHAASAPKALS